MTGTELEWSPVAMSEDFQPKYVGMVAGIIGLVILVLGFVGLYFNLS